MRFICGECSTIFECEKEDCGTAISCPHCGHDLILPANSTSPGVVHNDFILKNPIGQGGMGTVYLAYQMSLDRNVALKILNASGNGHSADTDILLKEARAAASLNHPNIVQAYAIDSDEDITYFAMEYVAGLNLLQLFEKQGIFPSERIIGIAVAIASALSYAWREKKIIHRDIKPVNILISNDCQIKLTDLGLACRSTDITAPPTEILGTPQYMPPEVALGKPATIVSDIYSLGGTLYHIATGQFPFTDPDPTKIVDKLLGTPLTPVWKLAPQTPEPLAALIEVMLSKRPCHRHQNYEELLLDLARVKVGKMPARLPKPEFQLPIDLNSASPLDPVKTQDASLDAPQAEKSSKEPPASETSPRKTPDSVPSPLSQNSSSHRTFSHKRWIALLIGILLIAFGGTLAVRYFSTDSEFQQNKRDLRRMKSLVKKGDAEAFRAAFEEMHPHFEGDDKPFAAEFQDTISTFIEAELELLRHPAQEEALAHWNAKTTAAHTRQQQQELSLQQQKETEEKARQQELQEKKETEAKRLQEKKRLEYEKLAQQKQMETRNKMLHLTCQGEFEKAIALLETSKNDFEPAEKKWAQQWMDILALANKFHKRLYDSEEKCKGAQIYVLGDSKNRWEVVNISQNQVNVALLYRKKENNVRITYGERVLDLNCLLKEQLEDLAEFIDNPKTIANKKKHSKKEAENRPPTQTEIEMIAYMISKGQNLQQLQEKLKTVDSLAFLNDELPSLSQDIFVETLVNSLRKMPRKQAQNLQGILQKRYPDSYQKFEQAIKLNVKNAR